MPGLLLGVIMMFTSCGENVEDHIIYGVGSIAFDKSTLSFHVGDAPVQLRATVGPENATYRTIVEWTTTDPAVAIVTPDEEVIYVSKEVEDSVKTDDGIVRPTGNKRTVTEVIVTAMVKPVGPGTATIIASREGKAASCAVTVE